MKWTTLHNLVHIHSVKGSLNTTYTSCLDTHPYKPLTTLFLENLRFMGAGMVQRTALRVYRWDIFESFLQRNYLCVIFLTNQNLTYPQFCLWMKFTAEIWISKASHTSGHACATHHHNISLSISTATISHCQILLSNHFIRDLIHIWSDTSLPEINFLTGSRDPW